MPCKVRAVLIAVVILAIGQSAHAQWQNIGLPNGAVALAIAADGSLYAAAGNSLSQSVSRRNPVTLVWEACNNGIADQSIQTLAADPGSPGTLYAGSFGRRNGGSAGAGVFKTTDGGLTWTPANSGLAGSEVRVLAIDPMNPTTLYAGTLGGDAGLYKSTDGAGHWAPANNGLPALSSAQSIAIDPHATNIVYAGIYAGGSTGDGPYKSTDGGQSWHAIPFGGQPPKTVPFTAAGWAIDPTNTSTIYAGSFIPISLPAGGGVYKSTNGGDTWTPISNSPGPISSIVLDPRSPTTIYAADELGGVSKSTDGGAHWTDVSAGLRDVDFVLAVDPNLPGTIYAANFRGVFQLSGNGSVCAGSNDTLCLGGRFKVQVNWRVRSQGTSGAGQAVLMSAETGAFWFFSSNNIELVVKVLDGRAVNNKFWVFYGALSNVEYTITVTDTQTGAVKTYFNPSGTLGSVADTAAFTP